MSDQWAGSPAEWPVLCHWGQCPSFSALTHSSTHHLSVISWKLLHYALPILLQLSLSDCSIDSFHFSKILSCVNSRKHRSNMFIRKFYWSNHIKVINYLLFLWQPGPGTYTFVSTYTHAQAFALIFLTKYIHNFPILWSNGHLKCFFFVFSFVIQR